MPNQSPFKSDYDKDSRQTSREGETLTQRPPAPPPSQTASTGPGILPPDDADLRRYGTGKPRRVVIRGRISRD
jgi:hypothetical protein